MFEPGQEDLIEYCFRFMISKDHRLALLRELGIEDPTQKKSMKDAAHHLRENLPPVIRLAPLIAAMRERWKPADKTRHLSHLTSGKLKGHDWHGAMPSFLHLSLQNKVREVCGGKLELDQLVAIGADIARHEYFMVATHDLLESALVDADDGAIPSLANKSVSDFVFRGIPYDLKNVGLPNGWTVAKIRADPVSFAQGMYDGADSERMRKEAENSINNWGLNRFYVLVADVDRWLTEPEKVLRQFILACATLGSPMTITAGGITITCHVVILE